MENGVQFGRECEDYLMRGLLVPFLFLLFAPLAGSEDRVVIVWGGSAEGVALNVLTPELSSPSLDFRPVAGDSIVRLLDTSRAEQAFFGRSRGIAFGSHDASASLEKEQVFKVTAPTAPYADALKSRSAVIFVRLDKSQADQLLRDDAVAEENSADRDSF
jgi:hypothetical protein